MFKIIIVTLTYHIKQLTSNLKAQNINQQYYTVAEYPHISVVNDIIVIKCFHQSCTI